MAWKVETLGANDVTSRKGKNLIINYENPPLMHIGSYNVNKKYHTRKVEHTRSHQKSQKCMVEKIQSQN